VSERPPERFAPRLRRWLAVAGFAWALAGVVVEDRRIVWVAIGILAIALVLRLLDRRRMRHDAADVTDGKR
jgi:hypothetical protein